jgi:hypothetical protein
MSERARDGGFEERVGAFAEGGPGWRFRVALISA